MKKNNAKILVFNLHYLPGFKAGGVVQSLKNISDRLGKEFDFYVATFDRDIGDDGSYPGITPGQWTLIGNSKVWYFKNEEASLKSILKVINSLNPDLIYLNSFFDPKFTQKVLWAKWCGKVSQPVLLAPHGEFSPGALKIHRLKKLVYLSVCRLMGIYRNISLHASSAREKNDILKALPYVRDNAVHEALNVAPEAIHSEPILRNKTADNQLSVCFLSRISPMKNLDFAIRALERVKSNVAFSIYGPIEDISYWSECQGSIAKLPANIVTQYLGQVHPSEVLKVLRQHDLFFLPTRGENYGHVIHEALSAGLPVLISDQTPWRDLESKCLGWALPLRDPEDFAKKIEEVCLWSNEQRDQRSAAASAFGVEVSSTATSLNQNRNMFNAAMRVQKS